MNILLNDTNNFDIFTDTLKKMILVKEYSKDSLCFQNDYDEPLYLYNEKFECPNEIVNEITKERHDDYLYFIEGLNEYLFGYNDDENFYLKFGNIYNWTFFTDYIEPSLLSEQGVGLIIKGTYPYPVGYVYATESNGAYIDILYNSYDDYKIEYLKWKEKPIEKNLSEILDLYDNNSDCEKLKNIDFICNSMPTFTEYILIKKDLLEIDIIY
jgi:hypothetical protein